MPHGIDVFDEPPPSYESMLTLQDTRVKRRVKRTIMPKFRAKVAALGKAKVAEKKKVAKGVKKAAGKMEGRVKEKKRVKAGKKQIIKGIKKIGAEQIAKKKARGKAIAKKNLPKTTNPKAQLPQMPYTPKGTPLPPPPSAGASIASNIGFNTESESEEELEVIEIMISGNMYYQADDGKIYDPVTQEVVGFKHRLFK